MTLDDRRALARPPSRCLALLRQTRVRVLRKYVADGVERRAACSPPRPPALSQRTASGLPSSRPHPSPDLRSAAIAPTVREPLQRADGRIDQPVTGVTVHLRDQPEATRIFFEIW